MVHSNSWLGLLSGISLHVLFVQAPTEGVTFGSGGGCQLNGKMAVKRIFAQGIRILDLGDNVNGL